MIEIIPGNSRGEARLDWLESRHTFSFGDYRDPDRMGVGPLRVLNEDHVAPGSGFAEHPHRDMEILSYVLGGVLEHKDNLGNGSRIGPGAFQRMRAGTGILHSEWNGDPQHPLHFLQIWILPDQRGLEPGYQEFKPGNERAENPMLIASGRNPSAPLQLSQDADLYQIQLDADESFEVTTAPGRQVFLHLAQGEARLEAPGKGLDQGLIAGDATVLRDDHSKLKATGSADVLLFDLPVRP